MLEALRLYGHARWRDHFLGKCDPGRAGVKAALVDSLLMRGDIAGAEVILRHESDADDRFAARQLIIHSVYRQDRDEVARRCQEILDQERVALFGAALDAFAWSGDGDPKAVFKLAEQRSELPHSFYLSALVLLWEANDSERLQYWLNRALAEFPMSNHLLFWRDLVSLRTSANFSLDSADFLTNTRYMLYALRTMKGMLPQVVPRQLYFRSMVSITRSSVRLRGTLEQLSVES